MRCLLLLFIVSFSHALELNQWIALQDVFQQLRCNGTVTCPTFAQTDGCPTTRRGQLNCDSKDVLLISFTNMTGEISTRIGALTALTTLSMQFGSISSSIPTQIGFLTSLEVLAFVSNLIIGTIPSELNRLTKLRSLTLNVNNLSGSLPPLDALSSLTALHVSKNLLTGDRAALPTSLGPSCVLQLPGDSNCLDCTNTWQLCSCVPPASACLRAPVSTAQVTTAAPETVAVPASTPTSAATIEATTQLVAPSAIDEITSSTTIAAVSAAVIGGSVGGAVGGSTILVVFLALLCRSRRRKATPRDPSSTSAIELTSEQKARYSQPPAYASTSAVSDATGKYDRISHPTSDYGVAPPPHRAEQDYSSPPPPADSYGSAPQSYTSPPAPAHLDSAQTRPIF
jgi:hypothetical protein